MQLGVLGLGLCNESLLLGKVVSGLLSGGSRLQGGVVDEPVTDTGAQGSPSQNLSLVSSLSKQPMIKVSKVRSTRHEIVNSRNLSKVVVLACRIVGWCLV